MLEQQRRASVPSAAVTGTPMAYHRLGFSHDVTKQPICSATSSLQSSDSAVPKIDYSALIQLPPLYTGETPSASDPAPPGVRRMLFSGAEGPSRELFREQEKPPKTLLSDEVQLSVSHRRRRWSAPDVAAKKEEPPVT